MNKSQEEEILITSDRFDEKARVEQLRVDGGT